MRNFFILCLFNIHPGGLEFFYFIFNQLPYCSISSIREIRNFTLHQHPSQNINTFLEKYKKFFKVHFFLFMLCQHLSLSINGIKIFTHSQHPSRNKRIFLEKYKKFFRVNFVWFLSLGLENAPGYCNIHSSFCLFHFFNEISNSLHKVFSNLLLNFTLMGASFPSFTSFWWTCLGFCPRQFLRRFN